MIQKWTLPDERNAVRRREMGGLMIGGSAHGDGNGEFVGFGEEKGLAELICLFILESSPGHAQNHRAQANAFGGQADVLAGTRPNLQLSPR